MFSLVLTIVRNTEEQFVYQLLLSSFLPRYVLAVESSADDSRGEAGSARSGDMEAA